MPGENGTGSLGQGPVAGGGRGSWSGAGPGGDCVCPKCGAKVLHEAGTPCTFVECPECGAKMVREKNV